MIVKKTTKKPYFEPINPNPNFPEIEERLLKKWYEQGIVDKYLHKNDNSDKFFSFLDGPITANNPMGVHHAWGRTYKDLWQRYKNMRGFRQRFQNGFDCQGLWVEVEVEKELGLKSKKDIENLVPGDKNASIAKFVVLCRERVKKYSDIQTQQSKRLGYFMDWDNSYFTLSENNNYMIWKFLKVCHDNGWIYSGNDVVPWCPRCETAISQHEILTEDYKEVTHKSVYFRLPLIDRENEYLLVWTTTPWTIPANTAVAVDAGFIYVLCEFEGKKYWVVKELSKKIFGEDVKVLKEAKGEELLGLKYTSAFDDLPYVAGLGSEDKEKFHKVIPTDTLIMPITIEEGTGLVHTSTSTGEEDHKLGVKLGLPVIPAIDDTANYLDGFGYLEGLNAKDKPELILEKLEEKDFLFKILPYKHRYPACWRCKAELVWKVTKEWYIAMDRPTTNFPDDKVKGKSLRERMIDVSKNIKWIPRFGMERELDWLKNMHDWLISKKNRYWGLALPIWECECGNFAVIGSYDELRDKTVEGWDKFEGKTPHKPEIDFLKLKCDKCGKLMSRIEPVGNPWLDAGIVAYSTVSENNRATLFEKSDEEPLYTKDKKEWEKWVPADFITESFPGQFKNWFYSLIAMSTVMENIEPAKTILGFATLLAEDGRPMHKSTGNSIEFNEGAGKIGVDVMRWLYTRQNPSDNLLFGYKIGDEIRRRFHLKIWNVYNYFVTYATLDNWSPDGVLKEGKLIEGSTNILDRWILTRLTETLNSVEDALDKFDSQTASVCLEEFVDDLSNWYIRRSRVRTGFTSISDTDKNHFYETTYFVLLTLVKILAPFTPFLSDEIYKNLTKAESIHLSDWPEIDFTVDGELLINMLLARKICEEVHAQRKEKQIAVRQPLNKLTTNIYEMGKEIADVIKDEVNVKNVVWGNTKDTKDISVELDLTITPDLLEEAKTRALIRNIQHQRKKLNVDLSEKIKVTSEWLPKSSELLGLIKRITLANEVVVGEFKVEKENK